MTKKQSETKISTNLLSGSDFLVMKRLFLETLCYPLRKSVPESRFVEIFVSDCFFAIKKPYTERNFFDQK